MAGQGKDLIDTRKRKRTTADPEDRHWSPITPSEERLPQTDLGAMLWPEHVPHKQYQKIQQRLLDQHNMIAARGREIKNRCDQIHQLKVELANAEGNVERYRKRMDEKNQQLENGRARLEDLKARAKSDSKAANVDLRRKVEYYENLLTEQTQVIEVGRGVLKDKSAAMERLSRDNQELRNAMTAKDTNLSALNNQLFRLSMMPTDQATAIANEAQAQRNLTLVQGLQNDVAERDTVIKGCQSQITELTRAKEAYQAGMKRLTTTVAEKDKALEAALKKSAEAEGISQDQAKLIQRLMNENARLVAGQKPY